MKKRVLLISILLHALLLITTYVLQGIIFPFVRINGLVPLMLPVAATGVALYEGRYVGGTTGLFAGILCDVSFNHPVGTFTVLLTVTGLLVGTISEAIVMPGFVTYYLCCAGVLVISAFVQMFPFLISQDLYITVQPLISTAIQQTIYSLILAFPIWFFVRALGKHAERFTPTGRPV